MNRIDLKYIKSFHYYVSVLAIKFRLTFLKNKFLLKNFKKKI